MKIVLIHCYSDNNKGDLGIILATIQLLRAATPSVTITAVSTFEEKDPYFTSEHKILRQHVDKLHPAVIGRVFSTLGGKTGLAFKTLCDMPKLLALFLPKWFPFRNVFLGKAGGIVAKELSDADLVISKGGSFLCSTPGFIGSLRLLRLLGILRFSQSLNNNVILWGQSLGPVSGALARKFVNSSLSDASAIVLREEKCKEQYPDIIFPKLTTSIGCDLAFSLDGAGAPPSGVFEEGQQYIGFTIKRFPDNETDAQYTLALTEAIKTCVHTHRKNVILIPHVTIDDDLVKSKEIFDALDKPSAKRVQLLEGDYSIEQLLGIYARLELLVGTRLHSTIFAMSVGTPAINIAYHGTKSQGVFSQLDLQDLVVESSEFRQGKIVELIEQVLSTKGLRDKIVEKVSSAKSTNRDYAKKFVGLSLESKNR